MDIVVELGRDMLGSVVILWEGIGEWGIGIRSDIIRGR